MTEITRRKFIQLTVVSGAVATGALSSGCQGGKEEITGTYGEPKQLPYVNQPAGLQDGIPQYFATTCAMCPAGCGIFVRTMAGRALKVEGNPADPVSRGKTCALGQASLQHLYNPGRLRGPIDNSSPADPRREIGWDDALSQLRSKLNSSRGKLAIVADADTIGRSPSAIAMLNDFAKTFGGTVFYYSAIDDAPWRAAAKAVYGRDQLPAYKIDEADVLVALGANFLERWPSPVYYSRLYGEFRQGPRRRAGDHGYFAYVGPRLSMTAANADEWFPCNPGTEAVVASGLQRLLGGTGLPLADVVRISGLDEAKLTALADKIHAAAPRALAMAGDGLLAHDDPTDSFTTVESLNVQTKSACVGFGQARLPVPSRPSSNQAMQTLIAGLKSGAFSTVLWVGQLDPVFSYTDFDALDLALSKAKSVAALSPFENRTTSSSDLVLPTRTFLEDWGDHVPLVIPAEHTGASLMQPIIDPSYILTKSGTNGQQVPWMDTRPLESILADVAQITPGDHAQNAVLSTWKLQPDDAAWNAMLSRGGHWTTGETGSASVANSSLSLPRPPKLLGAGEFAVDLYPHIYWHDGRHDNLPWMKEIPDPMTAVVWNIWAEINLQVAMKMGIRTGDIVRLSTPRAYMDLAAVPSQGIHPQLVSIPMRLAPDGRQANPFLLFAGQGGMAHVGLEKVSSAVAGYHRKLNTLVTVQDMPNGREPDSVKDLIHETAREWRAQEQKV